MMPLCHMEGIKDVETHTKCFAELYNHTHNEHHLIFAVAEGTHGVHRYQYQENSHGKQRPEKRPFVSCLYMVIRAVSYYRHRGNCLKVSRDVRLMCCTHISAATAAPAAFGRLVANDETESECHGRRSKSPTSKNSAKIPDDLCLHPFSSAASVPSEASFQL